MKHRKKQTQLDKCNRMVTIAKAFLIATPLIAYLYVSMIASNLQLSFQEVLVEQPNITIIFLIAMIHPYVAYLLHLMQKKLAQGDVAFAKINMVFLLIAQALTMNVFYFIMLLYVFYQMIRTYQIEIDLHHSIYPIKLVFYHGGGSFFVIMISTICLFASLQVM